MRGPPAAAADSPQGGKCALPAPTEGSGPAQAGVIAMALEREGGLPGVSVGSSESIRASAPATAGVAAEVP